jgi:hypothetical protein
LQEISAAPYIDEVDYLAIDDAAAGEFVLDQWRLEKRARNRCMRMAADRFDACPLNVQNALRARLITVFSARYLSVQKDRNHQKISARSNFSSIESRSKRAHMSRHGQS